MINIPYERWTEGEMRNGRFQIIYVNTGKIKEEFNTAFGTGKSHIFMVRITWNLMKWIMNRPYRKIRIVSVKVSF